MTTVPGLLMAGPDIVVEAVAARLEQRVPAELVLLEAQYGRPVPKPAGGEADQWRPPGLVARGDRAILEPDDYPALLVVPQNTGEASLVDVVDGGLSWRIPYILRIWGFVRYYGSEEVLACRNRLALATLQAMLRAPRLTDSLAVELSGWRQSFSDTGIDDRDDSTVAGWWLELTVNSTETLTDASVARAETISLAVHPEADD